MFCTSISAHQQVINCFKKIAADVLHIKLTTSYLEETAVSLTFIKVIRASVNCFLHIGYDHWRAAMFKALFQAYSQRGALDVECTQFYCLRRPTILCKAFLS